MTSENQNQNEVKLYPEIPKVHYEDISDKVNKNLSDARIKEIQCKRAELEKSLKHYKKILKRWKQIDSALKIGSIIIVGGLGVTTIVLGIGFLATPLILGILAAVGTSEGIISEAIVLGVVKKKVIKFKKKIEHIQEYISKSWFLFEKIREDSIINLQEIDEFRKLMDNYEKGLNIESDSDGDSEYIKLRESLKKQAQKEAKEEIKDDLLKNLKNEAKQKYLPK